MDLIYLPPGPLVYYGSVLPERAHHLAVNFRGQATHSGSVRPQATLSLEEGKVCFSQCGILFDTIGSDVCIMALQEFLAFKLLC